jgi:hypothetical protein
MTITNQIDTLNDLMLTTITDSLTAGDLIDYAISMSQGHHQLMDAMILVDPATRLQLSSRDVDLAVDIIEQPHTVQQPNRLALVARSETAYMLSRLYQAYSALTPTATQVFRTEAAALAWLRPAA